MNFPRVPHDIRWRVIAAALLGIALGGAALYWYGRGESGVAGLTFDARLDPMKHANAMQRANFDAGFKQAIVMLHARQYEHALTALHQLLVIDPKVPEVHVNLGFALLGLERPAAARDFFLGATELNAAQANAYYGLAVALDALGDRPGALGAMRTFIHLSAADDPWLPKARAALWEWQARSLQ